MTEAATFPVEITFRNIEQSAAVEARIQKEAGKLQRFHQRITSCRVVVSAPERHKHKGKLYRVRIQIEVPSGNLWINRRSPYDHAHADVYVAIRDAFAAATRRLEEKVSKKLNKQVKRHETPPHGVVSRLFPDQGYGFIRTPEEVEVYFNDLSVVNGGFKRLGAGSEVRYVLAPDDGPQGPQASTVKPIGKHHLVG
jgi:cold shock CspA family protein/ribosome-associated translation inhibitor RaiA